MAELLAERGDLEDLRARADNADGEAADQQAGGLGNWFASGLAAAVDEYAAWEQAELMAERRDLEELRARILGGDVDAAMLAGLMADLLTKQGRGEEGKQLRRFGLNPDGSIACA